MTMNDTNQGEVHILGSLSQNGGVYATTPTYILSTDAGCSLKLYNPSRVGIAMRAPRPPKCLCLHSLLPIIAP